MRYYVCIILFSCTLSQLGAQDIRTDRLVWSVSSTTNLKNSDRFDYSCVFITNGSNPIKWLQKREESVTEFEVIAMRGEWTDTSLAGLVAYQIKHDGLEGTFTISRASADEPLIIKLDFSQKSETGARHEFVVNQVKIDNPDRR